MHRKRLTIVKLVRNLDKRRHFREFTHPTLHFASPTFPFFSCLAASFSPVVEIVSSLRCRDLFCGSEGSPFFVSDLRGTPTNVGVFRADLERPAIPGEFRFSLLDQRSLGLANRDHPACLIHREIAPAVATPNGANELQIFPGAADSDAPTSILNDRCSFLFSSSIVSRLIAINQ